MEREPQYSRAHQFLTIKLEKIHQVRHEGRTGRGKARNDQARSHENELLGPLVLIYPAYLGKKLG